MRRARGSLAAVAFLAVMSALPAIAQSASSTDNSIPADSNKSFQVAVSVFQGEGLSVDNEYLKQSIPMLLVQSIAALQQHHFDHGELDAYQQSVLASAIAAQHTQIDELFQQRASILFQSSDPTKALEASTKSIDAAQKRLSFLEGLNPTQISVAQDKPIEIVHGTNGEPLVPYPIVSPAQTAKELNLGILVWGSVSQVEDYLVVHINIYDAAFDRNIYDFKKVFSPSNVLEAAGEVADPLARSVLGRDFGSLTLEIAPPAALVYLDGSFQGVGGTTIHYMTTGEHRVEIRAPGYQPETFTVSVSAFADTKKSIELQPEPGTQVVVSSIPAGADVYVASEWRGKTPVLLSRPTENEALVLRLKGYHDYTTTLTAAAPARIDLQLLPELFNSQDYISHLRDRFYGSFGAFALSLAIPVSFYSLSQEYLANAQASTNPQEFGRLKNLISVWYYAYLGGAFISSALFTNTVIDIVDYLRAVR